MAHVIKALVGETSATVGTGAVTLAGALVGHKSFGSVCSVGDTTEYIIRHPTDGSWEAGIGTYSATNVLTRTSMFESSTGSTVNFASGDKLVLLSPLASRLDRVDMLAVKSVSTAYTFAPSDTGRLVLHPAADTTARTWTIPANASVPMPVGTIITIDNEAGAGDLTIAITSDTMEMAGLGLTGTRTLGSAGQATIVKITSTKWRITGVYLS